MTKEATKPKGAGCLLWVVFLLVVLVIWIGYSASVKKPYKAELPKPKKAKVIIPNSELPLAEKSISTKADLTPEVMEAITKKQPRDPKDFERFVILQKTDPTVGDRLIYVPHGEQKANAKPPILYHAIPVAYSFRKIEWYTDYPRDFTRNAEGYPLDAYQLPLDPENDRYDNGVLRWQPMMIDGEEKMVYHQDDGHPKVLINVGISLAYHYPDLLPVDRDMYQHSYSMFNRRRGVYGDRQFPRWVDGDIDPLTILVVRVRLLEGYYYDGGGWKLRTSRNYIRGIPSTKVYRHKLFDLEAHYNDSIKYRDNLIERPIGNTGGLTSFVSKEGVDPGVRLTCKSKNRSPNIMYKCLGSAYFESIGMAYRFSYRRGSEDSLQKWQEAVGASNEMIARWKIKDVSSLEL